MKKVTMALGAFAVAAATAVAIPGTAEAAQACTNLSGPAGGNLPICKTWYWDGNDYDGSWWTTGPSSLPSQSYLQRFEDGVYGSSAHSGSYNDRAQVRFRICDNRYGCGSWW